MDDLGPGETRFKPDIKKPPAPRSYKDLPRNLRADVMRQLSAKLPTNALGLPEYIYRTDLIPGTLFGDEIGPDERVGILEAASVSLDYLEGYPSMPNGTAFWAKLDFEPLQEYQLFMEYLGVIRQEDDSGRLSSPVRTFEAVSRRTGRSEMELKDLAFLYYWQARVKAHDQFMVASFQKQREQRILLTEDSHFRKAKSMMLKLEAQLDGVLGDEDAMMDVKPERLLDMMERMMKMQRISLGLPANGGSTLKDEGPKHASLTRQIQEIAKNAGEESQVSDEGANVIDAMLLDPENLEQLQALIVRGTMNANAITPEQMMQGPGDDS